MIFCNLSRTALAGALVDAALLSLLFSGTMMLVATVLLISPVPINIDFIHIIMLSQSLKYCILSITIVLGHFVVNIVSSQYVFVVNGIILTNQTWR